MGNEIFRIVTENRSRNARLKTVYDPIKGKGCFGERKRVKKSPFNDGDALIPVTMIKDPEYKGIQCREDWVKLRIKHDFEYWAATCVHIKDKLSGSEIPFVLNKPQRRVAAMLDADRVADRPLRLIMLKARQWGGSTLIQMYMAWIQTAHRRNWHSLICAHVKDTAASIRGMYTKMLAQYPEGYWTGDEAPKFRSYERSLNTREIAGRGCRVTIGSSENQEAVRGSDYAMAHLSEVAFWSDTTMRSPEKFIRAVCGAIALTSYSLIVMESTANGVGNYFHSEWLRSKDGKSDKHPVFVPWYEIEIYRSPVKDAGRLWREMDDYERGLWERGLTLEMIQWYHLKRMEYATHSMMQAEYPTDDVEAFVNTGHGIFPIEQVELLRKSCRQPSFIGELTAEGVKGVKALRSIGFVSSSTGRLEVWKMPDLKSDCLIKDRYVVAVDIGGRSTDSDYSVIAVFDRQPLLDNKPTEIVAQWRGHIDHDLLTWKSATIASFYNNALLVIESNTLETENTEGDHGLYVLSQLNHVYPHMYRRQSPDSATGAMESHIGFHTNRATKSLAINELIGCVRDGGYVERSSVACDEMVTYEMKPNGRFGAKSGYHDDVLMTRAIGLSVLGTMRVVRQTDLSALWRRNSW